jgi:hypothetical protein
MAVSIEYERLTGKAFNFSELDSVEKTMMWQYAAIKAYNKDCKLSFDDLALKATAHEVNVLREAVLAEFREWCQVPGIDDEEEEREGDGRP